MIRIIAVGRLKDLGLRAGFDEYRKRLTGFTRLEVLELKNGKNPLDYIRPGELAVALDEKGENLTSHAFAEFIKKQELAKNIVFILGGPSGLSPSVLEKADHRLSLSRMTFTSQLARLILIEQIYRAFTIIKGVKYHK
ncbi:ribosomal RNA large subunit methyltransferase H [archaeon BMS3Bbin16]|nr:ribosomal RNA large subunit methyltransferase H [archaeon BMS3Bbin16]